MGWCCACWREALQLTLEWWRLLPAAVSAVLCMSLCGAMCTGELMCGLGSAVLAADVAHISINIYCGRTVKWHSRCRMSTVCNCLSVCTCSLCQMVDRLASLFIRICWASDALLHPCWHLALAEAVVIWCDMPGGVRVRR